ncbi:MAG: hypothetical protein QNJ94_05840 [Alphaproteobacteria bacterium]|nr:hypothetical protein [Alphaproteobacteria bacterium]
MTRTALKSKALPILAIAGAALLLTGCHLHGSGHHAAARHVYKHGYKDGYVQAHKQDRRRYRRHHRRHHRDDD